MTRHKESSEIRLLARFEFSSLLYTIPFPTAFPVENSTTSNIPVVGTLMLLSFPFVGTVVFSVSLFVPYMLLHMPDEKVLSFQQEPLEPAC